MRLGGLIDWTMFVTRFGELHSRIGASLGFDPADDRADHLQHTLLSDEEVLARCVEKPYWQYFCGFDYLHLALPIDPSSLVHWRRRISRDGIERLLPETIAPATRAEPAKRQSPRAGQRRHDGATKAIVHPLDSRLIPPRWEILFHLAHRHGAPSRQSYTGSANGRCGWPGAAPQARPIKRTRRKIRRLKAQFGRVSRNVQCKLERRRDVAAHFAEALPWVERLLGAAAPGPEEALRNARP